MILFVMHFFSYQFYNNQLIKQYISYGINFHKKKRRQLVFFPCRKEDLLPSVFLFHGRKFFTKFFVYNDTSKLVIAILLNWNISRETFLTNITQANIVKMLWKMCQLNSIAMTGWVVSCLVQNISYIVYIPLWYIYIYISYIYIYSIYL